MDVVAKWWSLVTIGFRASRDCAHRDNERRALCAPSLLPGVLIAARSAVDHRRDGARRVYARLHGVAPQALPDA